MYSTPSKLFAMYNDRCNIKTSIHPSKHRCSRKGVHSVLDLDVDGVDTEGDIVLQSSVTAGRVVIQGDGTGDGVLPIGQVLVLPDPPSSVNLRVVKEESWVSRRSEDISAWVATNGEVATRVDPVEAGSKVALHVGLEIGDVGFVDDEIGGVLVGIPLRGDPDGNIALEAAGVVGCS